MELLKWEDIKENEEYIDRVYGRITVHAKAIIKNEKLLNITYKDSDQFPVSFNGMKIFKEIYRVKTLEELGFKKWDISELGGDDSISVYFENINDDTLITIDVQSEKYDFGDCDPHEPRPREINLGLHKAIELKMIELGLWEEVW